MLKYVNYDVVFQEIPGETTLAINISNCPNRCPGCHSPYLWDDIGEELDKAAIDMLLGKYGDDITCLCIMGGDNDPEAVCRLAAYVKQEYPDLKFGWYSGKNSPPDNTNIVNFDYYKLGKYNSELGGLRNPKTNQRLFRVEKKSEAVDITNNFWQ